MYLTQIAKQSNLRLAPVFHKKQRYQGILKSHEKSNTIMKCQNYYLNQKELSNFRKIQYPQYNSNKHSDHVCLPGKAIRLQAHM